MVLRFFCCLERCASCLMMLMSLMVSHFKLASIDNMFARCSSQQAFTECQPTVVCSVLLQASRNRCRLGYLGWGWWIMMKDHKQSGTMRGIRWEILHDRWEIHTWQVGDSPMTQRLFSGSLCCLWTFGSQEEVLSRYFSLKFHNGRWFLTCGSQVQYLVTSSSLFFEGFVEVQKAFVWQNHRKSACILKEAQKH